MSLQQLCRVVTALLLLGAAVTAQPAIDDEESSQSGEFESPTTTPNTPMLRPISTLDGHCEAEKCRGFRYPNLNEVAFFDLKSEVRIKDTATYDIVSPMKYESLVFTDSTFAHFPLRLFYALNLVELDIRNSSIERVTWECFLSANNLNVLLLSENKLESIEPLTFGYASVLQFLFLDANRLRSLNRESFGGLKKLQFLSLASNQLQSLPDGLFDNMPALYHLDLSANQLRVIGSDTFASNPRLSILVLQLNDLRELSDDAFRAQEELTALDISHNGQLRSLVVSLRVHNLIATNCSLERINIYGEAANVDLRDNRILELYFAQPEALETLNLRGNSLEQISSLKHAPRLRSLDLSNNPSLQSLPYPSQLESLERLDLSNTSLSEMPVVFLAEQTQLRWLNVSHNRLRSINPIDYPYFEQLTNFYIHGNDWDCYRLQLLMDLLVKYKKMTYTRDTFDPDFPGEYIEGIACMYRADDDSDADAGDRNDIDKLAALKADDSAPEANTEVAELRKELKAIVGLYEQKFGILFGRLNDLNQRVQNFEKLNSGFWDKITITT